VQLYRAHGLGNDYLVLEDGRVDADLVRALCDRHTGVGADGLLEPTSDGSADYAVRIWNPDGSVAEKSGNGLRIFARWLRDERGAPRQFSISTGFDVVRCDVDLHVIRLEMGRARFEPDLVPMSRRDALLDGAIDAGEVHVRAVGLSIGNPHCVVFRTEPDLDALPWRDWGRALEVHRWFPNRTNVQVARVAGPGLLDVRVWERGAGPTEASGSSACAVAAAAVRTGRLEPGPVEVRMPGGSLHVDVSPELDLVLAGPVEPVGRVHVDPRWLRARRRR
jgi:diaminopimelate epimerase